MSPGRQVKAKTAPGQLFKSFFAAGFECSTHQRRSGWRLDLIAATAHDKFAGLDYARLTQEGIKVTREGVRWHLVESTPGRYDFSSVLPIVRAARATQTQVIWDLCHFGWPEHFDLFSPEFGSRLASYGAAFVEWLTKELEQVPFIVPVNEISYFSWAAGDEASMYPFITGRGLELKQQLVRATIATIRAIRAVAPAARFVQVDPIIHVVASPKHPEEAAEAEAYRESQYQAFDMLSGRHSPELGGGAEFLDVIGVNYYPQNQWIYNLKNRQRVRRFQPVTRQNPLYRPFREMLKEISERYERPVFIAETGAEGRRRAGWLRYVCTEAQAAMNGGVPLQGICLYPILNHPGWQDDRHCHNALWDYPDEHGNREIYQPLAGELRRWRRVFEHRNPSLAGDNPDQPDHAATIA
jgi:beta-glucosidase/6-phospho-beta-glucosidase/beta-galactosidase